MHFWFPNRSGIVPQSSTSLGFIYSASLKAEMLQAFIFCCSKIICGIPFFCCGASIHCRQKKKSAAKLRAESFDQCSKMARNSCIKWTELPVCENVVVHGQWAMFFWPYVSCCFAATDKSQKAKRKERKESEKKGTRGYIEIESESENRCPLQ